MFYNFCAAVGNKITVFVTIELQEEAMFTTDYRPTFITSDFEGVFIPEIWEAVAEETAIETLQLTTRDIPDYDKLMKLRLKTLADHELGIDEVQRIAAQMEPLPGAAEMIAWIRERTQFVILTDSFYPFIQPFLPKLGLPTVFAHTLSIHKGRIEDYHMRTDDNKRKVVQALHEQGFRVMSFGDSYNDTRMLLEADAGILFNPPDKVVNDFPSLPVVRTYGELRTCIEGFLDAPLLTDEIESFRSEQ